MRVSLFKKTGNASKKSLDKEDLGAPYLNARRTWNEHVGSVVSPKQTWQVLGILSMLIAFAAIGGMTYIGSQSKFIPYVVEVDKFGQTRAQGPVQASSVADPRVLHALVADFVQDARMVTPDSGLQSKAIYRLYARLLANSPAVAKMNEWMQSERTNPFKRAEKELVSVEIRTAIPQTEQTWQVEWTETVRDRKGIVQENPLVWRALITVKAQAITPQTTDEELRNNPFGLYVQDFSWSRVN